MALGLSVGGELGFWRGRLLVALSGVSRLVAPGCFSAGPNLPGSISTLTSLPHQVLLSYSLPPPISSSPRRPVFSPFPLVTVHSSQGHTLPHPINDDFVLVRIFSSPYLSLSLSTLWSFSRNSIPLTTSSHVHTTILAHDHDLDLPLRHHTSFFTTASSSSLKDIARDRRL